MSANKAYCMIFKISALESSSKLNTCLKKLTFDDELFVGSSKISLCFIKRN